MKNVYVRLSNNLYQGLRIGCEKIFKGLNVFEKQENAAVKCSPYLVNFNSLFKGRAMNEQLAHKTVSKRY